MELAPSPLDKAHEPRLAAPSPNFTEVTSQKAAIQSWTIAAGILKGDTVSRGLEDLPDINEGYIQEPAKENIPTAVKRVLDPTFRPVHHQGQQDDSAEEDNTSEE